MDKIAVGKITHFFPKISVAVFEVSGSVKIGDKISIEKDGDVTEQTITSMQVDHKSVTSAKKGESVGLKVAGYIKEGATVYKVTG